MKGQKCPTVGVRRHAASRRKAATTGACVFARAGVGLSFKIMGGFYSDESLLS